MWIIWIVDVVRRDPPSKAPPTLSVSSLMGMHCTEDEEGWGDFRVAIEKKKIHGAVSVSSAIASAAAEESFSW